MKKLEVFQTNAALACLIRWDKSGNGYNYLCIDTKDIDSNNDYYEIGEIVEDLEDIYLEETTYKINSSPLIGSYLFEY